MKIINQSSVVSIILETQEEIETIAAVCGSVICNGMPQADITEEIYDSLSLMGFSSWSVGVRGELEFDDEI